MNNEPVAWMNKTATSWVSTFIYPETEPDEWIPLYTHTVKELHLSLQKSKQTGELLAVTYTDDEHRIVEVLWQRPPVKEQGNPVAWRSQDPDGYWSVYQSPVEGAEPLYTGFKELTDEEIDEIAKKCDEDEEQGKTHEFWYRNFARAILRKAQE